MSQNTENIVHSVELFNTDDLMNTDDINEHKETENLVADSEDYETQIQGDFGANVISTDAATIDNMDTENNTEQVEQDITEDLEEPTEEIEDPGESTEPAAKTKTAKAVVPDRLTNLPLAKIKHIIKLDPEVNLVNAEAVYLITKCTEMFIKTLAKEAYGYAAQNKKKTITKSYVDQALANLPVEL